MKISLPENVPQGKDVIAEILKNHKTIAVVGLSSNPARPSFGVTRYMQSCGYRVIPVNPNETEVLGEKAFPSLGDIPKSAKIAIVDIFRRSANVPPVVDSAISIGAKVSRESRIPKRPPRPVPLV